MNKITSTLAGLAIVATASTVPAFAQGNLFSPPGSFTFVSAGTAFSASGTNDTYNAIATPGNVVAAFTLTGTEIGATNVYNLNTLVITPVSGTGYTYDPLAAGPLTFTFTNLPGIVTSIASNGADLKGNTFNLVNPVPEASTVVSFGALLALGGLAVVLRRKGVKNAV